MWCSLGKIVGTDIMGGKEWSGTWEGSTGAVISPKKIQDQRVWQPRFLLNSPTSRFLLDVCCSTFFAANNEDWAAGSLGRQCVFHVTILLSLDANERKFYQLKARLEGIFSPSSTNVSCPPMENEEPRCSISNPVHTVKNDAWKTFLFFLFLYSFSKGKSTLSWRGGTCVTNVPRKDKRRGGKVDQRKTTLKVISNGLCVLDQPQVLKKKKKILMCVIAKSVNFLTNPRALAVILPGPHSID